VIDNQNPGCVHFLMRTGSSFDNQYTANPTIANKSFFQNHFWRMQESWGYFDTDLGWYPNAIAYVDSSARHTDDPLISQHPDWVLHDRNGNKLYIPFACGGGRCSQYAMDIGNQSYRNYWINYAQGILNIGYKGLWIDDVNLQVMTSDGYGNHVDPVDTRTGGTMTVTNWERYFADFMTQVRQAMPSAQLEHNSIWYAGSGDPGTDPYVQQEMRAANLINRERGVSDGGLTGGNGYWSLRSLLRFADQVHGAGASFDIQEFGFTGDYAPACYFLISEGSDALGNDQITPSNWPANYDVQLGAAQGTRYGWNGLIRRDFANGSVFVDSPGDPSVSADVGSGFKDVNGNNVSVLNLKAKQGAILLKANVVIVPPPPPPPVNPPPPVTGGTIADGEYRITNMLSGMLLDNHGLSHSTGTQMVQWAATGAATQSWYFMSDHQGGYMIQDVYSQLWLKDGNGKAQLDWYGNSTVKHWILQAAPGGFLIRNKGTGLLLDDAYCSLDQGNGVITWAANGGSNQIWAIQ
jgi:hypothetical protein